MLYGDKLNNKRHLYPFLYKKNNKQKSTEKSFKRKESKESKRK